MSTAESNGPDAASQVIEVTIVVKPACHLCEAVEATVSEVVQAWNAGHGEAPARVEVQNMLDDPRLIEKYAEDVPVVLVDGRMHAYWTVDAQRFQTALESARQRLRG